MPWITVNQIRFALTAALVTVVFHFALNYFLTTEWYAGVWLSSICFFTLVFLSGWYFGYKDKAALPLAIAAFRFHLLSFLVFGIISILWYAFAAGYPSSLRSLKISLLFWGGALLIHGIVYLPGRNQRIKGIRRDDIFD